MNRESPKVLIVGYGIVGHNLAHELAVLEPYIYDKYKTEFNTKKDCKYKYAFICVDTPYIDKNNVCDRSQVIAAIEENDADIYVIKSAVLPGTVAMLKLKFPDKHFVVSPEYYGNTQHCNNFEFNFTILGGEKEDCCEIQQLLQEVYDARHTFKIVSAETAELAKYMENCWIYTKVAYCNQFYDIANQIGVDYEDLRECFILDQRVSPSFTFVYKNHPYAKSHCMDKDMPAIAETYDAELLKDIIKFNKKRIPN